MKIISKILLIIILFIFISVTYLSTIGFETDRFNDQIENRIKKIDKNIQLELKKIKLVLEPFKLKLNVKTIGSKLKNQNGTIEIESLNAQISLKTLIEKKFSVENLDVSTRSLEIKNLISFIRSFQNIPELFFLEKIIKKGYLIADIKLEFDSFGKIKDNYIINGFIKDTELKILKKYHFKKTNLIFDYKKNNFDLSDIATELNNLNFFSDNMSIKKNKKNFFVKGTINHKMINFNKKNLDIFVKPFLPDFEIEKLLFSSKNNFSFNLNQGLKFENFKVSSDISIDKLIFINNFNFKKFFPKIKKTISLSENKLSLLFKKNDFTINGKGNIFLQDKIDNISYDLKKKNKVFNFETLFKINNNPLKIDLLNYEKNGNSNLEISLKGSKDKNNNILIRSFNLKEDKNEIVIKNLGFNKNFEIIELNEAYLDYIDKENQKNLIELNKKKDQYYLVGSLFNANNLIDNLLSNEDDSLNIFNINSKISINVDKILLDNEYYLKNFSGEIYFKDKKIFKSELVGDFPSNKKLKFTINTKENNKITTLYVDEAVPIVRQYEFIKGFDEGSLDFYSKKNLNKSVSQLRIYNFKLKELPVLTKILTLASLQGIADILSGEGIRFDEFEMNFKNKGNLMTIEEIYAIGPAISILMEGYVEKNKLISLRGTLVPATTINKFIGSLPVLGKILVGSKTGEGVFGVSFKIKGPPKKLETTVNPIKTLTPRFITRTLEKIKRN